MPSLDLYLLPRDVDSNRLAGATVIVIDLLRASTTICTALAAGAECVMPFAEIDDTLAAANRFGRDSVLLGGERGGTLIPGFDLGNSPEEYTPQRVAGRRILFTTTNGARALHHARAASRILVGALVNRAAVARAVGPDANVALLCAGTDGEVAREDQLAAGALVEALFARGAEWSMGRSALEALYLWRRVVDDGAASGRGFTEHFADELRETRGGRNLIDIGQDADLAACSVLDALDVAPELNPLTGELRPTIAANHPPS